MKVQFLLSRSNLGRVPAAGLVFLASVAVLVLLVGLLMWNPRRSNSKAGPPLVVHCAAGLKAPVEAVAREYERTYGVSVQLSFRGSQDLLAGLEITKQGDLFIPADDSYMQLAQAKGLVAEAIPVARMSGVLAVHKGNPKRIRSLADLRRPDVRLAQANPEVAAMGKVTREALEPLGLWEPLKQRTRVFKPTVNDVANDLKLGTVDAGFLWDALLPLYPELEAVTVPALSNATAQVVLGVVRASTQPTVALHFARYLTAPERGLKAWERYGYRVLPGDRWAEKPELLLMSGAMLWPAIEESLKLFEQREGVRVNRVYNGCGILVAQMRAGERPDSYFSCDTSFMTQVADLFLEPEDVSLNQLVILVKKGNPHGIKSLKELGKPGIKLGVGHEKKCALGALTQTMLITNQVYNTIRRNVVVESPTGDFLVNQLRAGSLDAAIAYLSNAVNAQEELEAVPLTVPCSLAVQPLAVGRETKYPHLTRRLVATLKSAESKERFLGAGFRWLRGAAPEKPPSAPLP